MPSGVYQSPCASSTTLLCRCPFRGGSGVGAGWAAPSRAPPGPGSPTVASRALNVFLVSAPLPVQYIISPSGFQFWSAVCCLRPLCCLLPVGFRGLRETHISPPRFSRLICSCCAQVAAAHFMLYSKGANSQWEWDLSHSLSNASKGALRSSRHRNVGFAVLPSPEGPEVCHFSQRSPPSASAKAPTLHPSLS